MYEKRFTQVVQEAVINSGAKSTYGEVFWVNNSTVVSKAFHQMAETLSNAKVTFKGVTKTGISELMAVHHRASNSPYKLTSGMVGILTDSVIRRQAQHPAYVEGVKRLFAAVTESFKNSV